MTIAYQNTPEDAVAWHLYYWTHTREGCRSLRRSRLRDGLWAAFFSMLTSPITAAVLGWHFSLTQKIFHFLFSALFGFCVSYAVSVVSWRRGYLNKKRIQTHVTNQISRGELNHFYLPLSLEPLPEGLRGTSGGRSGIQPWANLRPTLQMKSHIALSYGGNDYLLIPRRAFQDQKQIQAFLVEIERFRCGGGVVEDVPQTGSSASGGAWWRDRYGVDTGEDRANLRQHR